MSEDEKTKETPKHDWRNEAETIVKMSKESQRVARRVGAESCIVICIFRDGDTLRFQDAGGFPMPPESFYEIMKQAHIKGQLEPGQKRKSKIIRPH